MKRTIIFVLAIITLSSCSTKLYSPFEAAEYFQKDYGKPEKVTDLWKYSTQTERAEFEELARKIKHPKGDEDMQYMHDLFSKSNCFDIKKMDGKYLHDKLFKKMFSINELKLERPEKIGLEKISDDICNVYKIDNDSIQSTSKLILEKDGWKFSGEDSDDDIAMKLMVITVLDYGMQEEQDNIQNYFCDNFVSKRRGEIIPPRKIKGKIKVIDSRSIRN